MISYKFIPMGVQAVVEHNNIVFPNYRYIDPLPIGSAFICDVGNLLGKGGIDHHTMKKENECATTLVFNEPDKYVQQIKDQNLKDYIIITHFEPDFDAVGCTYLVSKILENIPISIYFKQISDYILDVDLGRIQLDENKIITPSSLILAINKIINNKYDTLLAQARQDNRSIIVENKNKEILHKSHFLLDCILASLEKGKVLNDNNFFYDLSGFEEEVNLLKEDLVKYQIDLEHSKKYIISIPNRLTDQIEEVDFIATEYPKSLLWKYWVRGDRKNSRYRNGFIFTCAFLDTYNNLNRSRAIIATDRATEYHLKGLGMALDEAEINKILLEEKPHNLEYFFDERLGTDPDLRRKSFHRKDPWYDERDEYTVIDAPKDGSILSNDEILNIVLSPNYWIMLSKTLVDENGDFKIHFNELFPNLFFEKITFSTNKEEFSRITLFLNQIKNAILNEEEKDIIFKNIKMNLYCADPALNKLAIEQVEFFLLDLSKIPLFKSRISELVKELNQNIFETIIFALNILGNEREYFLQEKLFDLIKVYYDPSQIRSYFGKYQVCNFKSFSNFFYFSCKKISRIEFFKHCNKLFDVQFEGEIFREIINVFETKSEKDKLDKEEVKFRIKLLTILSHFQEYINKKDCPIDQEPLSAFDDFKDSIDDIFTFSTLESSSDESVSAFIQKDSNFFLLPDINIEEYYDFNNKYSNLKELIVFNKQFWEDFIQIKSNLESELQRYSEFNMLRKYTESFIKSAPLSKIDLFKELIEKAKLKGAQNASERFFLMIDKIVLFKTFENLLHRMQIVVLLNEMCGLSKKETGYKRDIDTLSASTDFKLDEFPLLKIFNQIVNHIIKAQYIPDVAEYQEEMQNISQDLTVTIPKCSLLGYTKDEIKIFEELKNVFDLVSIKSNIPIQEYDRKIMAISNIIVDIGDNQEGLLKLSYQNLNEPERSSISEILFNLRHHLDVELEFLNRRIKINFENDNYNTRFNFKNILTEIVNEATKDELRRLKQYIDANAEKLLKNDFYLTIIKNFRSLSHKTLFYGTQSVINNTTQIKRSEKNQKLFLDYSKNLRNSLLSKKSLFDLNFIAKQLIKFNKSNKRFYQGEDVVNIENIIIKAQLDPNDATQLPESSNMEIYEFLVNYFLDKYCIEEAKEKIEEYSSSTFSRIINLASSWWVPLFTIAIIILTFLIHKGPEQPSVGSEPEPQSIISLIASSALSVIIFIPYGLIFIFMIKIILDYLKKIIGQKRSKPLTEAEKEAKKESVFGHLKDDRSNKISRLSSNLLFTEFLIPIVLGVFVSSGADTVFNGILQIDGWRFYIVLPLFLFLSYYSLFNIITSKNSSFSFLEANKVTSKIFSFLFSQCWIISTIFLNFIMSSNKDFIDSGLQIHNILNFDFVLSPKGTVSITIVSLFIGLFVESVLSKLKTNEG